MDGATEREGGTYREKVGAGWSDVKDAVLCIFCLMSTKENVADLISGDVMYR